MADPRSWISDWREMMFGDKSPAQTQPTGKMAKREAPNLDAAIMKALADEIRDAEYITIDNDDLGVARVYDANMSVAYKDDLTEARR